MVRAGDIRQCTINGREMDVKGEDANVNIRVSGFVNEVGINGNGTTHITQRRQTAGFSDLPLSLDDEREDLEFLQGIANDGASVPVNLTLASGITYSGALALVGEIAKATGDGTVSIEMRGARFEQV